MRTIIHKQDRPASLPFLWEENQSDSTGPKSRCLEPGIQYKVNQLVIPLIHSSVLCMKIRPNSVSDTDKITPGQETSILLYSSIHTLVSYIMNDSPKFGVNVRLTLLHSSECL